MANLQFVKIPDQLPDWSECQKLITSKNQTIIVGVFPVLYGMRVRAGYEGEGWLHLDYCAGADQKFLERLYFITLRALENTDGNFSEFPRQEKKPYIYDTNNYLKLVELGGGYPEEIPKLPPIQEIRSKFLDSWPKVLTLLKNLK